MKLNIMHFDTLFYVLNSVKMFLTLKGVANSGFIVTTGPIKITPLKYFGFRIADKIEIAPP